MITSKDTTSRTRYLRVTASHHLTVGHVLAFADALREEQIPAGEMVDPHRNDTTPLNGLSVRVSESHDTVPGEDAATIERTRLVERLRREARENVAWSHNLDGSYVIERMADLLAADVGEAEGQADGEAGDE